MVSIISYSLFGFLLLLQDSALSRNGARNLLRYGIRRYP
jgi:hypothetical protein